MDLLVNSSEFSSKGTSFNMTIISLNFAIYEEKKEINLVFQTLLILKMRELPENTT